MIYSRSAEYAIRAFVHLAQVPEGKYAMVKNIAEQEDIPAHFLAKILQQLARKGLLRSSKGPTGGFALRWIPARSACWISSRPSTAWPPTSSAPADSPSAPTTCPAPCTIAGCPPFAYHGLFGEEHDRRPGQGAGAEEESLWRCTKKSKARRPVASQTGLDSHLK